MAVTSTDFLARFPEFGKQPDLVLIDRVLVEAARSIDPDVWGDKTEDGILYLAAHRLAISPYGRQMQLVARDGSTTYGAEYERMKRAAAAGYRVI